MKTISCPYCKKDIVVKLIICKSGMSRVYAYCWDCKCSVTKSVKRSQEEEFKKIFENQEVRS